MRDPESNTCDHRLLREVWQASPDMRLGQLLCNAHSLATTFNSSDLFYLDDEYLVEGLKKIAMNQAVSTNVTLRADIERIGHERDQMIAANVELQERLSRLEDDCK